MLNELAQEAGLAPKRSLLHVGVSFIQRALLAEEVSVLSFRLVRVGIGVGSARLLEMRSSSVETILGCRFKRPLQE